MILRKKRPQVEPIILIFFKQLPIIIMTEAGHLQMKHFGLSIKQWRLCSPAF